MRVLLSTYDSRGYIEPMVGLAVRLQALDAPVRVCAPPDCAQRLAEVGAPLVPVRQPVRPMATRGDARQRWACPGAQPVERRWFPAGTAVRSPHEPR